MGGDNNDASVVFVSDDAVGDDVVRIGFVCSNHVWTNRPETTKGRVTWMSRAFC